MLNLFGSAAAAPSSSGGLFGSTSAADAAAGSGSLLGGASAGSGLQGSRLFQSYGYGGSLFGGAEQQQVPQQQQRQGSADDEADLEGLMATLMCH